MGEAECASFGVLASPIADLERMKEYITVGTPLFLINFQSRRLMGAFKAAAPPEEDLAPEAFGGKFSAQVRIDWPDAREVAYLQTRMKAGPKTRAEVISMMLELTEGKDLKSVKESPWSTSDVDAPPAKQRRVDECALAAGALAARSSEPLDGNDTGGD